PALSFSLATGRERWFPLISHGTLLVLLLAVPGTAPDSLLALGALTTVVNLQRRNGRFFRAVGWTFLLLALGLGVAMVGLTALGTSLAPLPPFKTAQVEGAFALVALLLGALFID
ncbi:MAG: CPP1-like family protein, partial [Cyanobacteriota bacterium]|nr:CPP1-like family protein [Cyanobacteriota bacterium]